MPNYSYTAFDRQRNRQEGVVEANSLEEAGQSVRKMDLRVINIRPARRKWKKPKLSELNITPPKVSPSLKIIFFRELSTLIDAGVQLVDGLVILELQIDDKYFSRAIRDIIKLVKAGRSFSDSLADHPRIFSRLVVSLVKAAELGGGLSPVLQQIAGYIEREDTIRRKLKSATSYPRFIMGFFLIVLGGVVFGLLPRFKSIFESFDAELPGATLAVLAGSNFVRSHLVAEIVLVIGIAAGYRLIRNSRKGRLFIDRHRFSLPIVGSLMHQSALTRITQTLSVLLSSGVSLIEALKLAGQTADNLYVDQIFETVGEEVSKGKTLSSRLAKYPALFPVMISSMVAVGEKSGALPQMLGKIAQFSEQDFSVKVDKLSTLIEPIMMGGLGVIISIIVLALYLPIFKMSGAIH